jgi:hypothetical protein
MSNPQVPQYAFRLPWFMFDLYNRQLITSPVIPGDIKDSKQIVLAEQPVPGLNYAPVSPGGGGNRKVSFTLQLIRRNNTVGNVLLLKQFAALRNQAAPLGTPALGQFTGTPKVLYYWGVGSVPLVWWVAKADMTHKQGWVNALGYPQYSEIEIELVLDESAPLYRAEELFRQASVLFGEVLGGFDAVRSEFGEKPY